MRFNIVWSGTCETQEASVGICIERTVPRDCITAWKVSTLALLCYAPHYVLHHYSSLRSDSFTLFTKELSFYIAKQITLALNFLENCDLIQFCTLFMQPQKGARSNNYLHLNCAIICYIPDIPYTLILAVCFINYMYDMLLSHSPARYVHLDEINPINIKKLITCSIRVIGTGYTGCMKI